MRARTWTLAFACALVGNAFGQSVEYAYDVRGRLVGTHKPTVVTIYSLDPAGNRTDIQTITGTNLVVGSNDGEWILATGATEQIYGLRGDDMIGGGEGNDTVDGGPGWDTTVYTLPSQYTFARQVNGTVNATNTISGSVENIKNVEAAWFFQNGETFPIVYLLTPTNVVNGTGAQETLNGTHSGAERINAGGGDDFIAGNGGQDFIDGGLGTDYTFHGATINNYAIKWVTIGSALNAGVQVTYLPTGDSEVLVNTEHANFAGTWYAVGSLPNQGW